MSWTLIPNLQGRHISIPILRELVRFPIWQCAPYLWLALEFSQTTSRSSYLYAPVGVFLVRDLYWFVSYLIHGHVYSPTFIVLDSAAHLSLEPWGLWAQPKSRQIVDVASLALGAETSFANQDWSLHLTCSVLWSRAFECDRWAYYVIHRTIITFDGSSWPWAPIRLKLR